MNWNRIERLVAWVVFAYALVLYLLTVAPTASFWDSGEFIAIANRLQVSHPPGAPFFMLIGRLFSMFVPVELVAFSVNLVSVLSSAATIVLTHLIIVRLVREWQTDEETSAPQGRVLALSGGVIGACTFAATDSFWFNAVEAELYALSMFFTAVVVWLIMRWSERARLEEAQLSGGVKHPFGLSTNRYLLLIAYLFGLATGVHLLNLLAIFYIALIVFFTEYERGEWETAKVWRGMVVTGLVASAAFLLVYPGIVQGLPTIMGSVGSPLLAMTGIVVLLGLAIHYTQRHSMQALNLVALSVAVVLIGYSTYALIFIRSASDPPIDENDPETAAGIVSYLKREQYGATPLLRGSTYDNRLRRVDSRREKMLPRRHSLDQAHWRTYEQYDSDLEFFADYQVGHMYVRYFMWNFGGRASDTQDSPWMSGLFAAEEDRYHFQTPSERAGQNTYFLLPLFLGLMGMMFHFWRDWRRAFAVLILFLVTGIGIILYLNQTPMQPRERDYSYVASFFAFSLWIGVGATGLMEMVLDRVRDASPTVSRAAGAVALAVIFAAVPGRMLQQNFDDHDRSGRYVAPDYAYNMLMSVAEDAVLFTNGDNDTFPLWYLQEVERERTDVRVANLSLMNTDWYVRQLKNQWSRESAPVPISMSEREISELTIRPWRPTEVSLPVNRRKLIGSSDFPMAMEDSSVIESPMTWELTGRPYDSEINLLYGADQVALDILSTNARQDWERPVYFAVTVAPDGQLDLDDFFQIEGQAFRVVPIRNESGPLGRVETAVTPDRLRSFRLRNVDNPDVYFDENIRNMLDNYRNVFSHTARTLSLEGDTTGAVELLDWIMERMPFETIPGDESSFVLMANAYMDAGDGDRAVEIAAKAEPLVLHRLRTASRSRDLDLAGRYAQMIRFVYFQQGNFEAAADFGDRIADILGDSSYRLSAEELRDLYDEAMADTSATN